MKITVKLDDALHLDARRIAARDGLTLSALAEEGLGKLAIDRAKRPVQPGSLSAQEVSESDPPEATLMPKGERRGA